MTPFEAGLSTGGEASFGSGKEARAGSSVLLTFVHIDEAAGYTTLQYSGDLSALVAAQADAAMRGVRLVVGVVHYTTAGVEGNFDRLGPIVPEGESFPFDHARRLARGIVRSSVDGPTFGLVLESPEDWFQWVLAGTGKGWLVPGSRIVFALDTSGSMVRGQFQSLPEDTIELLGDAFPGIETGTLPDTSDERWLEWPVRVWNEYLEDHPEV